MILYYCLCYHIKYFFLLIPLKRLKTLYNGEAPESGNSADEMRRMKMLVLDAWKTSGEMDPYGHVPQDQLFLLLVSGHSSELLLLPWTTVETQEPLAHTHIQPGEGAQVPISFTFSERPQKCHW